MLGGFLLFAGINHFAALEDFRAQVPTFLPWTDAIVHVSGVVELALGSALILATGERRVQVGVAAAAFFVAVFPGNVSQLVTHTDAFGLDTDAKRAVRLVFQPILVLWALWSTGALTWLQDRRRGQ